MLRCKLIDNFSHVFRTNTKSFLTYWLVNRWVNKKSLGLKGSKLTSLKKFCLTNRYLIYYHGRVRTSENIYMWETIFAVLEIYFKKLYIFYNYINSKISLFGWGRGLIS